MQGVVQKYYKKPRKAAKPYGFIQGDNGNIFFFDGDSVIGNLNVGDKVFFHGRRNVRGYIASQVQVIL